MNAQKIEDQRSQVMVFFLFFKCIYFILFYFFCTLFNFETPATLSLDEMHGINSSVILTSCRRLVF